MVMGLRRSVVLLAFTLVAPLLVAPLALALAAHAAAGPGTRLWTWWDDSPTHALDGVGCVARGPNGSLYGAADYGFNYADGSDIGLIRFRSSGTAADRVIWKRTWDNPNFHKSDYPIAMAVDPAGNAVVAGQTATTTGGMDGVVIKWLANGTRAWKAPYANLVNTGDDWVTDVACDTHGNVYVSGSISDGGGGQDWLVVKYRASDGKILWREFYNGPASSTGYDSAEAMVLDRYGNIYVTGTSANLAGNRDLIVIKVTPRGTYRWMRRFDGAAHLADRGREIGLRAGYLYVAGETEPASGDRDAVVAKYSTRGRRVWVHTWRSAVGTQQDVHDMAVDRYGNTIVAGWAANGAPGQKAILVKWDANGHRRWARTYWNTATGEPAYFTALAVDGSGRIWAVGSVGGALSSQDALVMRYGASGRRVWKATFGGTDIKDDWLLDVTLCGTRDLFTGGVLGTTIGHDDALAAKFVR
jgi:hypothetical protein